MPEVTWTRTFSWSSADVARAGVETRDGGVVIVGSSRPQPSDKVDFHLVKLSSNGNLLWAHTYGGESSDWGMSVIQTTDGGFALTGYTCSYGAGSADAWLIKTNADGEVEWERTYGEANEDIANVLIQTADGGYALAGMSRSYGAGDVDGWIFKTDAEGGLQWSQTYGGPRWDEIESLVQTNDSGFVFVGRRGIGDSASPSELWVSKIDTSGIMQWNYTYGGKWNDQAYAIIPSLAGGYAIAGRTVPDETGLGGTDFWLVKTDAQGLLEWDQTYGGMELEEARSMVQTTDGGYALLGKTDSFGAGSFDFWLVKTDTNGTIEWNQTYGGPNCEWPHSLVKTTDGGLVLLGSTDPPDRYNFSYFIVKIGGELTSDPVSASHSTWVTFMFSPLLLLGTLVVIFVWRRKRH